MTKGLNSCDIWKNRKSIHQMDIILAKKKFNIFSISSLKLIDRFLLLSYYFLAKMKIGVVFVACRYF